MIREKYFGIFLVFRERSIILKKNLEKILIIWNFYVFLNKKMSTKFERTNHDDILRSYSKFHDLKKVSDEMLVSEYIVKKLLISSGVDYDYTKTKVDRVIGLLDHDEVIKKYHEIGHTKSTAKYFNISVTSLVIIFGVIFSGFLLSREIFR